MRYEIEIMLNTIKPTNRKRLLFYLACNRHIWFYLNEEERDDVEMLEADCKRNLYEGIHTGIFNGLGAAITLAHHVFEPSQSAWYFEQEREWQYKLLLHMFHNHKWELTKILQTLNHPGNNVQTNY